jgi:hypothetical protein
MAGLDYSRGRFPVDMTTDSTGLWCLSVPSVQ